MNYKDYELLKMGRGSSVGRFGDNIYAYEVLTGACNVPGYYQITKDEFDTFEQWQDETSGELGTKYEIVNRKPLCSGYKGETEIKTVGNEFRCPDCHTTFLLWGGDIPENLNVEKICPKCNKKPEPRMDLMLEVKRQLTAAGIRIKNLGSQFTSYYIDPFAKQDMRAYVSVGERFYYLRVNERGKVILEYKTKSVKVAAYWILKRFLNEMEYQQLSEEEKRSTRTNDIIVEKCKLHFQRMDSEYWEWFCKGIDVYNFDLLTQLPKSHRAGSGYVQ